jgi:hypothetical protein
MMHGRRFLNPNQDVLEEIPAPPAQDAWEYAPEAPEYHHGEGFFS